MPQTAKVLVVDDDLSVLESFIMILGIRDYQVTTAKNIDEAVDAVKKDKFNIAFIDLRFYGKTDEGINILKKLKELDPALNAVICTGYASEKTKIDAIQGGAMDYISKPFMMEVIYELVERALKGRS